MIKIPFDNTKIDLLDSFMVKSEFVKSYQKHETKEIEGCLIKFIGIDDLIQIKKKSNRGKDLIDVKNLLEIKKLIETNNDNSDESKENKSHNDDWFSFD